MEKDKKKLQKEQNKYLDMYFEDKYRGQNSTMKYKIERQYLRQYYENLLEDDDIDGE